MEKETQSLYSKSLDLTLKIGNLIRQKRAIQAQLVQIQAEEGDVLEQIAELTSKLETIDGQPQTDQEQTV